MDDETLQEAIDALSARRGRVLRLLEKIKCRVRHISDTDLERYFLGMIPKDSTELKRLEEHLFWCPECVARAEETQDCVDAIRAAIIAGWRDLIH